MVLMLNSPIDGDRSLTDRMIEFPIALYDSRDIRNRIKEEDDEFEFLKKDPSPLRYAIVKMKMPLADIIGYHEYWERGKDMGDVINDDEFPFTCIISRYCGELITTLSMKDFEYLIKSYESSLKQ